MTRQYKFKAEMAVLLKKYNVEISVDEDSCGWEGTKSTGINFWSYAEYDQDGNEVGGPIDFKVGVRSVNHTDFQ